MLLIGAKKKETFRHYTLNDSSRLQTGYNSSMPPFYTRNGDQGKTGVLGEERLDKFHPVVETLGSLDEASAALGFARSLSSLEGTRSLLVTVQRDLYSLMSEVAAAPGNASGFRVINQDRLHWLESRVDAISTRLQSPGEFILPGDTTAGAALDLARTSVRRAERRLAELTSMGNVENPLLLPYLNRLSSLCFVLELEENQNAGRLTTLAKE